MSLSDRFAVLPLFSGLLPEQIRAAAELWTIRSLPAGTPLWGHGELADEMAVVLSGSLSACINDRVVGGVPAGELVGEAAAWTGGLRTASVVAAEDTELAVLKSTRIPVLRRQHDVVYDRLLESALTGLARRVRSVDRQIARLAYGEGSAPGRRTQSTLSKLWRRLTASGPGTAPPARQALRAMPALKTARADCLTAIEAALIPRHLPSGTAIFLEGDSGESIFLVAEGCIDVIRHVRGGRGERLASLYPGALFGTGSLLLGERRNASCVAANTTACWVFEMNQQAFARLGGEPGRLWRESILEALRFQLARADEQLGKLKTGTNPQIADYERIRAGLV